MILRKSHTTTTYKTNFIFFNLHIFSKFCSTIESRISFIAKIDHTTKSFLSSHLEVILIYFLVHLIYTLLYVHHVFGSIIHSAPFSSNQCFISLDFRTIHWGRFFHWTVRSWQIESAGESTNTAHHHPNPFVNGHETNAAGEQRS